MDNIEAKSIQHFLFDHMQNQKVNKLTFDQYELKTNTQKIEKRSQFKPYDYIYPM